MCVNSEVYAKKKSLTTLLRISTGILLNATYTEWVMSGFVLRWQWWHLIFPCEESNIKMKTQIDQDPAFHYCAMLACEPHAKIWWATYLDCTSLEKSMAIWYYHISLFVRILVCKSQHAIFTDICIFGKFCWPKVHNSSPTSSCLGERDMMVCCMLETNKYWLLCIKNVDPSKRHCRWYCWHWNWWSWLLMQRMQDLWLCLKKLHGHALAKGPDISFHVLVCLLCISWSLSTLSWRSFLFTPFSVSFFAIACFSQSFVGAN